MSQSLQLRWELDSIFPGGSGSAEFADFLRSIKQDKEHLQRVLRDLSNEETTRLVAQLPELIEKLQSVSARLREAMSYIACLMSQDTSDQRAFELNNQVMTLQAEYESVMNDFSRKLAYIPEAEWKALLEQALFRDLAFNLQEQRDDVKDMFPSEQEAMWQDLCIDGYHGWSELYDTIVSRIHVQCGKETLSVAQAANKLNHPNREVRKEAFEGWEAAWADAEQLCAAALNRIGGFRLSSYKHRGWSSVLVEPLKMNRMTEDSLQAMWQAINEAKPVFVEYLHSKAARMGLERLSWYDVDAPITDAVQHVSYEEAAQLIQQHFASFSPKMADFAKKAFHERWIEAEDRPGKRPGGFCTPFPVSKQTRIFMTYGGTASNVATLAHELGHAFHQHVMDDMPELTQQYAMNVAETASTFAEWIVADAALLQAEDDEVRLKLLDEKVQNAVAFYMNIHARFLFEMRYFEERAHGIVSPARLSELMESAQREAYCDALDEWHPRFWASKLHFYLTDVPFYNFPYTFGYLFSAGLYAKARKSPDGFEDAYIHLLRDTGRLTVEQLAQKHLHVDLTKPDFWREAVAITVEDAKAFITLSK